MLLKENNEIRWVPSSLLQETHYQDFLSKSFEEFRQKYKKISKTPRGLGLYVNFTDHPGDTIDKNPSQNPNHSDPIGHYGYPLKYVVDNPADVWYGVTAKYLRVFEDKSKKKLWLQGMGEQQARSILSDMGLPYTQFDKAKKAFGKQVGTGSQRDGKIFFLAMQHDFSESEPKLRSGVEQTRLLVHAGFDSVEDRARNEKSAVINSREPEQIIFLNRGAFDIVETYQLRDPNEEKLANVTNDPSIANRKLAAMIASAMDDSLTGDEGVRENKNGWEYFYTKDGNLIKIYLKKPQEYYANKKIGEKKHKEAKLSTPDHPRIVIETPYGDLDKEFFSDDRFHEIASFIATWWSKVKENDRRPDWNKRTKQGDKDAELKATREYLSKKDQEESLLAMKDMEDWKLAGKKVGLDINIPSDGQLLDIEKSGWKKYQNLLLRYIYDAYNKTHNMSHEEMKKVLINVDSVFRRIASDDDEEGILRYPWMKEFHSTLLLMALKFPKANFWESSRSIHVFARFD